MDEQEINVKLKGPIEVRHEPDAILGSLVLVANLNDYTTSVTLMMSGMVIVGDLISQKKYFEQVDRESDRTENPLLSSAFKQFAGAIDRFNDNPNAHHTIHLENVYIFASGLRIKSKLWRGSISAVDGFILGPPDILKTDEPE